MSEIETPTCEQINDGDGFLRLRVNQEPWRQNREPWRHGNYITAIFMRESDNACWKVQYALSTDGETNELREGTAQISQCWPYEKTVTDYGDTPPA